MGANTGGFVWYDLMTPDPEAAILFYSGVVGWGTQPFEIAGMPPYTMWTKNGGQPIGGVAPLGEAEREKGLPPHWLGYVGVADIDAAAVRVGELGGTILHPPTDIPTVGRFAVIADPQGAALALFSSLGPAQPLAPPEPGDFSWHELATSDYEAAFDFYSKLFGWQQQEEMDLGGGCMYRIYGLPGHPLGGMFHKPAEMPGPPAWLYYALVPDLDGAIARLTAAGGTVVNGPMDVPGGDRIVQAVDPQGAFFALHARAGG